jgi:hypothetical protein
VVACQIDQNNTRLELYSLLGWTQLYKHLPGPLFCNLLTLLLTAKQAEPN